MQLNDQKHWVNRRKVCWYVRRIMKHLWRCFSSLKLVTAKRLQQTHISSWVEYNSNFLIMLTDELKLGVWESVDLSSVLRIWFHNIYTDTLEMKKYYSFINFLHFYSSWTLSKLIMCLSAYFDLLLNWQQLLKSSFSDSFWSVSDSYRVCPPPPPPEGVGF